MGLAGELTGDQAQQVATIESSGKHLLSIINDLLDLAKIESGKVDLAVEPVDCRELLDEVAASLRSLAEDKGLELAVDPGAARVLASTDRRALSQILINLVGNAIKFTEEGSISLTVQQGRNGSASTRFLITDTGVGIAPQDREALFQAFEQIGGSATRRHDGTGLGLYISRKLADLLHGSITCESEVGVGSTFVLELTGES
jgi:protein-histidine pros-kinase